VRLDGDEVAADADDGDAGHFSRTYMGRGPGAALPAEEPEPLQGHPDRHEHLRDPGRRVFG
jgi:hypothetical protein